MHTQLYGMYLHDLQEKRPGTRHMVSSSWRSENFGQERSGLHRHRKDRTGLSSLPTQTASRREVYDTPGANPLRSSLDVQCQLLPIRRRLQRTSAQNPIVSDLSLALPYASDPFLVNVKITIKSCYFEGGRTVNARIRAPGVGDPHGSVDF